MAPRKTLAMVQTGPRALEPRDLPVPEIDDDSALLRVEACGICGSDYEQYEGMLRTPVPVIPTASSSPVANTLPLAGSVWSPDLADIS